MDNKKRRQQFAIVRAHRRRTFRSAAIQAESLADWVIDLMGSVHE